MSNRRKLTPQPPPEATAYAAAYRCGHCTGKASLRRKPDRYGVWHINVFHDTSCPVYTGRVSPASSGIRALGDMTVKTGSNALYVIPPAKSSNRNEGNT